MREKPRYQNRLVHETSPYLLQHAHNPVDWYPWGEEAQNRAQKEDKPVFLSIGYSACHWCHVMEKESFENEAIAKIMNERFVNIKVDREERPDLDELYMNAVQVMIGRGGWPMSVFLTPDLVPFHSGTYFPPEDRMGIPGFPKVLLIVADYYRNHRGEVNQIGAQVKQTLLQIVKMAPSRETMDMEVLSKAFETLRNQFDFTYGGFGKTPKFPSSMALSFLLRYWKRTGLKMALEMVEVTLEKMALGGIYDPLGGGFHRYSVDERWQIPHFEKMLYDNALLARTYFDTYQATRKEWCRHVAEEILEYVFREMRSPEGGFYSTQDADNEGEEGKFYVWTRDQIMEVLGKEMGNSFCDYYGVTSQGNFEGKLSVLNVTSTLEKVSRSYGMTVKDFEDLLEEGRKKLFTEREKRVKPSRDEKILTSWNGLMISSFIDGFKITENQQYLLRAEEAACFILEKMREDGHLMRVFNKGRCQVEGFSEDYAFFIQALIDLYEATFDVRWLKEADELNRRMIKQFWDEDQGGFFFTGNENEPLIARSKNPYDNALPSSNSVGVFNLIRLSYLTGDESLKQKAEEILHLYYNFFSDHASGFAHMLSAFSFFIDPEEIGIIGSRKDLSIKAMLREIYQAYLPNKILSFRDPKETIEGNWFPFLKEKELTEIPTVYLCKGFTCLPPAKSEEELKKILV